MVLPVEDQLAQNARSGLAFVEKHRVDHVAVVEHRDDHINDVPLTSQGRRHLLPMLRCGA